jgi:hypothetical protein
MKGCKRHPTGSTSYDYFLALHALEHPVAVEYWCPWRRAVTVMGSLRLRRLVVTSVSGRNGGGRLILRAVRICV